MMTKRLIERLALRAVPADWRAAVDRDLSEEFAASSARFAAGALLIGARLRAARLVETWPPPGGRVMRDVGRDIRLAVRGIARRPGSSLAVIATLAIGIGANTAIFSVFNWILFRPMPGVSHPADMVTVRFLRPKAPDARFYVSYRDIADLRDAMPALSGLAASSPLALNVSLDPHADPTRIDGEIVTADYFDVLGVTPQAGRRFLPSEERPGPEAPSAIVSDGLWRRALGGRAGVLGEGITIGGHLFTIVGIAPAGFQGRSLVTTTDVWIPMGAHPLVLPSSGPDLLTNRRRTQFGDAFGRLRAGATAAHAQQQASAAAASVQDFGGRRPGAPGSGVLPTIFAGIGHDTFPKERLTTLWRVLTGAVILILVLACANAANLLLARGLARRRELAVCQAIGAGRFRLIRQQIAEGVVLSMAAALAGVGVAQALTHAFDGMRLVSYLPAVTGVAVDWRVGLFTLLVAIATGLLFSIVPAVVCSRVDLQSSLKDGVTGSQRGRGRLRATLVTVQIAVSVMLLVCAGLFARTLHSVRSLDLGLRLDGLITFAADPSRAGYSDPRAHAYFRDLVARLRAVPGVEDAAYSWRTPYSNIGSGVTFTRAEGPDRDRHTAGNNTISPRYFTTTGTPLLAGRDFTDEEFDRADGRYDTVIVNRRLARAVFPAGDAVGSHLILEYPKGRRVEIVGVVGDVRGRPVTDEPDPSVYLPGTVTWGSVNVRSSLPLAQAVRAIRDVARAIDPALPPYDVEPMAMGVDRVISEQRLLARLSALFAAVAAALATIGVYGMMAGSVAERRREFGIRLALGAAARSVTALVLRGALPFAIAGVTIGLAGSLALRRAVESRLFGVRAWDPITLAAVAGSILCLALAASLVPALRAARVDPVQSLRAD